MEDLKICQKPTKYGQVMFCEAIKVDMANSKEALFSHTISSTLSLITVVFEDYLKPSTYTRTVVMKNRTLNHPSHYQIKPLHVTDTTSALNSSAMMITTHSKKNR
jgi:hypothetical protein